MVGSQDPTLRADGARAVRRAACAVLLLEAAVLGGCGIYLGIETVVAGPADRLGSAFLVLVVFALAAGLTAVARGLSAGRRWSRAPALVWQAIQALVGLQFAQGAVRGGAERWQWGVALPLLLTAAVAGIGVLRPGVVSEAETQP
jgi:hypothetical protein